jgi:hypothetical protein
MKRTLLNLLVAALLVAPAFPQAQKATAKSAPTTPQKSKSFVDRVLEFLSISYTPASQKGPAGDALKGQIWIADVKGNSMHALSVGADYRSPVFISESSDVLALRGSDVVRIPATGGDGKKLYSTDGILKLVGGGSSDPNQVLVLLRNESGSHPHVGLLAIDTGAIADLPYDPASTQELQLVEDLEGSSRVSGENRVFVKRQTREDISGTLEWTDVFLIANGQQPVDVSRCEGVNCGQPSISHDGSLLVYVKEKTQ